MACLLCTYIQNQFVIIIIALTASVRPPTMNGSCITHEHKLLTIGVIHKSVGLDNAKLPTKIYEVVLVTVKLYNKIILSNKTNISMTVNC